MGLRHSLPSGKYCSDIEKEIVLLREFPAVWKKIYRREWLIKEKLYQPEIWEFYNQMDYVACRSVFRRFGIFLVYKPYICLLAGQARKNSRINSNIF